MTTGTRLALPRDWSQTDLPDLTGNVAVVTGANGGLGYAIASGLAGAGACVVMACRNPTRAQAAVDRLHHEVPHASVESLPLDLESLDSIAAFCRAFEQSHEKLDILCNNAGIMAVAAAATVDGYERQMATNHLGHFALTGRLLGVLERAPAARVVTMSSLMHVGGRNPVSRIGPPRTAHGLRETMERWSIYADSKLANLMFCFEFARRAHARQSSIISCAAHPGYADTGLQTARRDGSVFARWLFRMGSRLFAQSPRDGARPALYAATGPHVKGGDYFGPGVMLALWGPPRRARSSSRARDEAAARRLWQASIDATNVAFWPED